ncbi:hypothetical protein ACJX0J_037101, partial [Zea mays]
DMLIVSWMEGPRHTEKPTGVIFLKVCFYSRTKTHLASQVVFHLGVLNAGRKIRSVCVLWQHDGLTSEQMDKPSPTQNERGSMVFAQVCDVLTHFACSHAWRSTEELHPR